MDKFYHLDARMFKALTKDICKSFSFQEIRNSRFSLLVSKRFCDDMYEGEFLYQCNVVPRHREQQDSLELV